MYNKKDVTLGITSLKTKTLRKREQIYDFKLNNK